MTHEDHETSIDRLRPLLDELSSGQSVVVCALVCSMLADAFDRGRDEGRLSAYAAMQSSLRREA
jgi:hypothetical protein